MNYILVLVIFFVIPEPVYGYLDPGTGSYIFQIVVASLLAGGYFFKDKVGFVIKSIKSLFKKLIPKRNVKK